MPEMFAPAYVCSRISRRSGRDGLREEVPARLTELRQDPAKGIPVETVFSRLEARHHAKQAKAK
ncbi:hypothetical protein X749_32040 [Mesorhizobium sp. LNJC391B00]|nr:hypothetical protein X749_32040 [Mesorhizobium sp. LNJC391B00]